MLEGTVSQSSHGSINTDHFISTRYLDENFYRGLRNTLGTEKLLKLAQLAEEIPIPFRFGQYESEEAYTLTLKLMLNSTAETRRRGWFFKRRVLPYLNHKDYLLDIGPGDGQLTCWVGNYFKSITAIDNNSKVIEDLNIKRKILRSKIKLHKICNSILDVDLNSKHYDLALLSHILYYIEPSQWLSVVSKVYETIKKEGILAIVLSGDNFGKNHLIKHFDGYEINIDSLVQQCANHFGGKNIEVFCSREVVITSGLNAMLHIAGFFLYDGFTTAHKGDLKAYLKRHCDSHNNLYKMTTQQKFILIRKT